MTAMVEAQNVSKSFWRNHVLHDVSFSVPKGAIFALVGPNGAGKSTTLKLALNIHRVHVGNFYMHGVNSTKLTRNDLERIGYVSENQEMPGWMTVRYYLDYWRPFYPQWDRDLERALLKQFALPEDRKLKHLSRGMRMQAALISSLAYRPAILLLDEPFSGLDAMVRDDLIAALLERAEETTVLISSHDLAEIESFASHVAYLDQGRIQFSEELADVQARFREVTVTFAEAPALPADWPAAWLRPERGDAVVRFIDSRFDETATRGEIRRRFPQAQSVEARALPLREIFVTLARESRRS